MHLHCIWKNNSFIDRMIEKESLPISILAKNASVDLETDCNLICRLTLAVFCKLFEFHYKEFKFLSNQDNESIKWILTGQTQGGGADTLPRQEEMFWGVQVSKVQEEVDEWQQLGQHLTVLY